MDAPGDLGQTYADRLGFLMRWSAILASCLDKQDICEQLARAAVPYLADWCSIILRDSHGRFSRLGVAHVDPRIDRRMRAVGPNEYLPAPDSRIGIPRTIRTGKSELLRRIEITEVIAELSCGRPEIARRISKGGATSMMTTPLLAHGKVLGAMSMYNRLGRAPFESIDLVLAEEISRRAALTLYTLLRLENAGRELEVFEHAMSIYRNFIVARVEDARTPLTAGRLKVELLSLKGRAAPQDPRLLKQLLADIDQAVCVITTIADDAVFQKLVGDAKVMRKRRAA